MAQASEVLGLGQVRELLAAHDPEGLLPPCGLAELIVGPGALERVRPAVFDVAGAGEERLSVALLVDETTILRGGQDVKAQVLAHLAEGCDVQHVVLSDGHPELHVTDDVVADAVARCEGAEVVVALGGGTISDIGKLVAAHQPGTRLVTVMTAASVDGYTDDVSVILKDGVKRTVPSVWPDVVIADAQVVAEAPARMNQAGYGEMVSMFVAPADWQLAAITGMDTSFHRAPIALLEALSGRIDACAAGISAGEPEAVQELTQALALRGIATGVAGTTACLSGVEHLISHMLDLRAAELHLPTGLHGEQVGAGSVIAACAWEMLHDRLHADPAARIKPELLAQPAGEKRVRDAFSGIDPSGRIGEECWRDYSRKLAKAEKQIEHINAVLREWAMHRNSLRALARPSNVIATGLRQAGAPVTLGALGSEVGPPTARWAVQNCALMRERFTVVDLLTLLGWWDDPGVDEVLDRARSAVGNAVVSA